MVNARYTGDERRKNTLSESEFEAIAQRASQIAMAHVYEEVGKSVLKKLSWAVGLALAALIAWLSGSGKIQIR